jgi:hypothetical protein
MTHYEPSTPRVACGIAAIAMTVLTFALMVGLPATSGPGPAPVYAAAAPVPAAPLAQPTAGSRQTTAAADCERPASVEARSVERRREQQG